MSNAMVLFSGGPAEIDPLELEIMQAAESELTAYNYIPTRIKFPSGGMSVFSVDDTDTLKPPVKMIVAVAQKVRAFWPDSTTQGIPSLCQAPDSLFGIWRGSEENAAQVALAAALPVQHPALVHNGLAGDAYSCAACPLGQWTDGQKPLCKENRRLLVLVEGWSKPAVLTLPPTSLRIFDTYASARARVKGEAYFTCWTRVELEQDVSAAGIKYSRVRLTADAPLSREQKLAVLEIRRQYEELVRGMEVTSDDYEVPGPTINGQSADADIPF